MPLSKSVSMAGWPPNSRVVLLLLVGLSAMAAIGILAGPQPAAVLGLAAAVPLAVALVVWPNAATLSVIAILYSNAAVIAVRFHGLPYILGALVPILLAVPLAHYVIVRRQPLVVDQVFLLILAFLVIQLIAALFSSDPGFSVGKLLTFVLEGVCLYFLVINVVRTPAMLRAVTWVLLGVGAFLGGLSACQEISKTYHDNYGGFAQMSDASFAIGKATASGETRQRRLSGPIGEENRYAQVMLMLVPLGMFRFWSERSRLGRSAALVATLLAVCGMALTFSRGAAIGFALMVVIMVLMRYITLYQFGIMLAGMLITLLVLPQYAYRLSSLASLGSMFDGSGHGVHGADTAVRGRYTETLAAARMFADHPLVGVGPGMYPAHYRHYAGQVVGGYVKEGGRKPHILYLGIAAELGAAGLMVYLLIVLLTLRNLAMARRQSRLASFFACGKLSQTSQVLQHVATGLRRNLASAQRANMATGYMLALVTYLTTGLFLHFAYIRYFWLILALAGVAARLAGQDTDDSNGTQRTDRPMIAPQPSFVR